MQKNLNKKCFYYSQFHNFLPLFIAPYTEELYSIMKRVVPSLNYTKLNKDKSPPNFFFIYFTTFTVSTFVGFVKAVLIDCLLVDRHRLVPAVHILDKNNVSFLHTLYKKM